MIDNFTPDAEVLEHVVKNVFQPMRSMMRKPLNEVESKFLIRLMATPRDAAEKAFKKIAEEDFSAKIAKRRASIFNVSFDARVLTLLSFITGNPGDLVLYVTYSAWLAREERATDISLDFFAREVCPWGFLRREDFWRLWDAQKVSGSRNGLDSNALIDFLNAPSEKASAQ